MYRLSIAVVVHSLKKRMTITAMACIIHQKSSRSPLLQPESWAALSTAKPTVFQQCVTDHRCVSPTKDLQQSFAQESSSRQ